MDFSRLIQKYTVPFVMLEETDGQYDQDNGGIWVPGAVQEVPVSGAVLPLSNEDIRYDESGTYTAKDRKIFTYTELKLGRKVIVAGIDYTLQEEKDYGRQAGIYIYFAKRAGGVDE